MTLLSMPSKFTPFLLGLVLCTQCHGFIRSRSATSTNSIISLQLPRQHHADPLTSYRDRLLMTIMASTNDKGSTNSVAPLERDNEPLKPERVAALIEKSFVEACMQLAQGFVDILKLFVVSTKAGYELETPPADLIELVNNCPTQSAGRPLMKEEQEVREQWINAVYLTLEIVEWKESESSWTVDENVRAVYAQAIPSLAKAKEADQKLQTEHLLKEFPTMLKDASNVVEKAIVVQTLKVIWITLDALQEEELAKPRNPRPKIPGAFEE